MSAANPSPLFTTGIVLKRAFDFATALLGLILLSPFFTPIALWIKRDSPSPALYRGRRAGRGGKEFHILKFRSMYEYPCGARTPGELPGPEDHGGDQTAVSQLLL